MYYNYTVLQNTYNILDQYKILEDSTFGPKLVSKYVYFVMILFVIHDYWTNLARELLFKCYNYYNSI